MLNGCEIGVALPTRAKGNSKSGMKKNPKCLKLASYNIPSDSQGPFRLSLISNHIDRLPPNTRPSLGRPANESRMAEQTLGNTVAIVSGSNSGIGAAIIRELSSRGASTVINYPFPSLKAEAESLSLSLPMPSICVEADMSTTTGPKSLVDATMAAYGRLDIVVNSAGLAINLPFEEQNLSHWDSLVNLNGRGVFLLTQAALPHLTRGRGRIVNIVSLSSRAPPPLQTIYAGTKGMVDSFTRCWAKELPPTYGCTVNAVSPGPTMTEGFKAAGPEAMKVLQPTIDSTPVGKRMGDPSEIAFAVGFLCEERARWVNGEHLMACGGLHID